jgi:Glycosyl hydrolase family 63 C-terminal domain
MLLQILAQNPGVYQSKARNMYTELRKNLVSTVYESWKSTGFAWEQYNPETGAGQRSRRFTGWTALIVKIMAMPDLTAAKPDLQQNVKSIFLPPGHQSSWKSPFLFIIAFLGLILALRRKAIGRILTQFRSFYRRMLH